MFRKKNSRKITPWRPPWNKLAELSELFPLRFSEGGKGLAPAVRHGESADAQAEAKREARSQNRQNSYYEVSAE
ncbi:hypothetical protein LNQ52_19660 [Klebsiella pneumoniae subsp. pneumoniae]|nr:hypothetical protein [Klebsiella pneumoniae subsp. pneumoniae]